MPRVVYRYDSYFSYKPHNKILIYNLNSLNIIGTLYIIYKCDVLHSLPNLSMCISSSLFWNNPKDNYIRKIFFKTKVNEINVSVSLLRDIAPIIVELLKNRDKGTFNLCNEGTVTENQILQLYKKYIIKKFKWKVEKDLRDKGECYSVFDTTLISLKKYELPNALESIEKFLSNYDKSIEE